ncbi:MAG TPA: hypothetical protein VF702_01760 [Allosphingosinicella sp.]
MTDGRIFLAFTALVCLALFLVGLRSSRTPGERRIGRIMMIWAPLFLLIVAALCFGLFGPVDGIETIDLD